MNRNHWKLAGATALLSLCVCVAGAQAPDGPPPGPTQEQAGQGRQMPGPDRELNALTRVLSLTADQQTGVKAVLTQQFEQMKALRQKARSSNETAESQETMQARRSQMEAIRNESDTKIAALLDDGQKKTFADWTARRKAEMEKRRARDGQNGPPPPPPNE